MKPSATATLLSVLIGSATTALAPAQTLPRIWNRSADWVAMTNPSPDSEGNLVWHIHQRRGCCLGGLSTQWDSTWNAWVSGNSSGLYNGAGRVTKTALYHRTLGNYFRRYLAIKPEVWFRNTTGKSFLLKIEGSLSAHWVLGAKPAFPQATVRIEFLDLSLGSKVTSLFTKTVAKPVGMTTKFAVDIPTIRIDPGDVVRYTIVAATSTSTESYVALNDTGLRFVRKSQVLATEVVRNASPKNPLVLAGGRTSRPVIDKTWDPYLSNAPATARGTLLAVGASKLTLRTPLGTFLTEPLVVMSGQVGVDFSIPIPNTVALVGLEASVQGAAITATNGIALSNALDVQIGDL